MSGEPSSEKGARYKQAPASSSRGAGDKKIIVVFALGEVYIYIPAELSAAGFELKIAGSVQLTDKVRGAERVMVVLWCATFRIKL